MSRPTRLALSFAPAACAGWLLTACSFHASYETRTGENQRRARTASAPPAQHESVRPVGVKEAPPATGNPQQRPHVTEAPAAAPSSAASGGRVVQAPAANGNSHVRPGSGASDAERRAEERRRRQAEADAELARVDRETKERVAEAERQAEEDARKLEAEQDNARTRVTSQRKPGSNPTSQTVSAPPATPRDDPSRTLLHKDPDHDAAAGTGLKLDRPGASKEELEKKAIIRKRLDQNKADILIAAERKRNEIHASLKDESEKKP